MMENLFIYLLFKYILLSKTKLNDGKLFGFCCMNPMKTTDVCTAG